MYQERPTRKFGRLPLLKLLPCFLDGPTPIMEQTVELGATKSCEVGFRGSQHPLAWIIHEVSSQRRKDALKGMMNTGLADPAFPFGASIA